MSVNSIKIKKCLPYLFIFVLIFLFLAQNHVFIQMDNLPPFSDASGHLLKITNFYFTDNYELDTIIRRDPYPPLSHWVGVLFFRLMGPSVDASQYSLFVFVIILLLSLYGIGYEYGGHYSGAAVMALGASSPHIINYSRVFFVDFPQTAMTALTFYILLKTKNYQNRFFSILLGFVFCLGFFTKWSITFFMLLPLVWFVLPQMIRSRRAFLLSLLFGILSVFFLARLKHFVYLNRDFSDFELLKIYFLNYVLPGIIFVIAANWWKKARGKEWNQKTGESFDAVLNAAYTALIILSMAVLWILWAVKIIFLKIDMDQKTFGVSTMKLLENLNVLPVSFNYSPLLIILGIILIFVFRKREDFEPNITGYFNRLILPVNLVFSLFWVSYVGPYDIRYVLSFCIFAAAIGGWWVGWIGKARVPVTVLIVILSTISFAGWLIIPEETGILQVIKPDPYRGITKNPVFSLKLLTPVYPSREKFDMNPIVEELAYESSENPRQILWISETESETVSCDYIDFLTKSRGLDFRFEDIIYNSSKRDLLKYETVIIITCHNREVAYNEIEFLREYYRTGKVRVQKNEFNEESSLYLIKIEK